MALEHNCGVALVYDLDGREGNVVETTAAFLHHLTNRGHDMTGISAVQHGIMTTHHALGTPKEALHDVLPLLKGSAAIGHVRYTTNNTKTIDGAHPRTYPHQNPQHHLSFAFNGQIALEESGIALLHRLGITADPDDDTGMLGQLLWHQLQQRATIEEALHETWNDISGAHNGVALLRNGEAFAWADPLGIHPLIYAQRGNLFAVLSETNPVEQAWQDGITRRGDIQPGTMVHLQRGKEPTFATVQTQEERAHCPFEYYYFMKRASRWLDAGVTRVRIRAGEAMADIDKEDGLFEQYPDIVVVPIPETGKYYADGYSDQSGHRRVDAIIKQRGFDKRTFILSGEGLREKFSFDRQLIRDRDIVLFDDSIVRCNTMPYVLQVIREDCAPRSIHVRSGFPIVVAPCFYGINMSNIEELWWTKFMVMLHQGSSLDDVRSAMVDELGVQSLKFFPHARLPETIRGVNEKLCRGCTEGIYPTRAAQQEYERQVQRILAKK